VESLRRAPCGGMEALRGKADVVESFERCRARPATHGGRKRLVGGDWRSLGAGGRWKNVIL